MKVVTIVGARPQFIKASAFSRAAAASAGNVLEVLVHTGQHYDQNMSDIFFRELGMAPPHHSFSFGGAGHGEMTGHMLIALEDVLKREAPDAVLVYGDTNSTLAGALAASKLHIPLAHVEAGLRSHNRRMPEEINRVITDHISDWLFCPTDTAISNLATEGILRNVSNVGDIMYDVALFAANAAKEKSTVLERMNLVPGAFALATVHRQENTDISERLASILNALNEVAAELPVVLPLHPRTRQRASQFGISIGPNIRIVEPLGYLDMVMLESNAAVIATDSGGVQKEAFFYGVPCVTLREETEWIELIQSGWNRLANPEDVSLAGIILSAVGSKGTASSLYGNGDTADRILEALLR